MTISGMAATRRGRCAGECVQHKKLTAQVAPPPIKGAQFKSKSEYLCPVCDVNLNTFRTFGIEIDGCDKCQGIWLDRDELKAGFGYMSEIGASSWE
jgi:ribosomal protein L37AE/L43A